MFRRGRPCGDVAYDPLVAIAQVPKFAPDVALLDIGLPGMDGYALARRIIELTAPNPPRLIAITGYGSAADRARSFAAGFNELLTKPVDFEQLLAIVAARGPSDTMRELQ
jgi:CheY-like chemotaxis protein